MTEQLDLFANAEQDNGKEAALKYIASVEDYARTESKGFDHAMFVCIDSEDYHLFITSVPHLHKCKPISAFLKGKQIVIHKQPQ